MTARPLFTAALALAAGLAVGRYMRTSWWLAALPLALAVVGWITGFVRHRARWRFAAAIVIGFGAGLLRIAPIAHPQLPPNHILHWVDQGPFRVEGTILSTTPPGLNGDVSLTLAVRQVWRSATDWTPAEGRLLVHIRRDAPPLGRGDVIVLRTDIRRVTTYRSPGAFDRIWWLGGDGIYATGYLRDGDHLDLVQRGKPGLLQLVERVRAYVRAAALRGPPERAATVLALVLGDQSRLDRELVRAFQATGIIHLLSISGLHVSGLAGLVFFLGWAILARLGRLPLRTRVDRWAALIALPFPIAYALLAGGMVSVVRACVMYLALIVGLLIGRRRDLYSAVALAAIVVLLYQPASLWTKGFQFSFAAVWGMIYYRPAVSAFAARATLAQQLLSPRWLTRRRRDFLSMAGFSLAAFAATAPVSLWHFGYVAPLGIVANIGAIPLFNLLVVPPLLFGTALLPFSEPLAQVGWAFGTAALDQVFGFALLLERLGPRLWLLGRPTWWEMIALGAVLVAAPHWRRRGAQTVLAASLLTLLVTPAFLWWQNRARDHLAVTMIDVHQGLSVLVETPGGKRLLFDGGGESFSDFDVGRAAVVPLLSARRIGRLDVVVASHAHPDHYRGLAAVLDSVPVGEVWAARPHHYLNGSGPYFFLLDQARRRGIPVRWLDTTTAPLRLGKAEIGVLNPPPEPPTDWSVNDQSIMLCIKLGADSVLLTADAGGPAEARLLAEGAPLHTDLIQVAHHGSATASSPLFVSRVSPKYALISYGCYNRWGHPATEVVQRWKAAGASVIATENGTIRCSAEGGWTCRSLAPATLDVNRPY